ncbi:MAG TPA: ABC transporter permease [Blastocatellia bacterium]|nr:ABC transporter permease [Blastocatellia bacterium]
MRPNWNHIVRERLAVLRLPPEREIEIVEEVALHLEAIYDEALLEGLSDTEAQTRAVNSYDWRLLECELSRVEHSSLARWLSVEKQRGGNQMESLLQDLRFSARMSLKQPGLALIAVLTLALGIGANTTIFSAIESVILHPFSFPHQDRLVAIYERIHGTGMERSYISAATLHDWREQSRSFEQFVISIFDDFTLTGGDRPEQLSGYWVSAGFFSALGVQPMLGRTFQPDEDTLGREQVVVLKHSLWERLFAADPKILGQVIKLDSQTYTVIGVMPKEFNFPHFGGELWIPWVLLPGDAQNRENRFLRVIGLLKPGVSQAQGEAEIRALSLRAQQQYPATNKGVEAYTVGLNKDATRDTRVYLSFTLGAVAFVLLIACANVANLLLARGAVRQKELAVRMALGAGRWRVMRQLLTESLLLALLGGVVGLGFSVWGVTALANGIPQGFSKFIPGWERLGINTWALGFTVLVSLVTGVVCGLLPAWQATKSDFNETLKEGSKGAASGVRNRWRNVLVVAEVALSLVLLIGAGLVIRSFIKILNTDLGFNPDNTMAMSIVLPRGRYDQPEQRIHLFQELAQRAAALPGVTAVGLTSGVPPGGWGRGLFQIVGQPAPAPSEQPRAGTVITTAGYFAAVGTPLRAGRLFTAQDDANAPRVVLVNEALARRYFADRSAIGQRLNLDDGAPYEIVGIVANTINANLDDAAEPVVYQSLAQRALQAMWLIVRAQPDASGKENVTQLTGAIRQELAALDATLPLTESKTLHESYRERSSPKRVITVLLGVFALLALVMATVGLYAVMSFAVAQRTHEIGVRMALGAQTRDIFSFVVKQGFKLVSLGIIIGLLGAYAVTRLLSQVLYGVTATDPLTYAMVAGFLLITALVACVIPARRATKVDPLVALRCE